MRGRQRPLFCPDRSCESVDDQPDINVVRHAVRAHVASFLSSTPSILTKLPAHQRYAPQVKPCHNSNLVPGFVFRWKLSAQSCAQTSSVTCHSPFLAGNSDAAPYHHNTQFSNSTSGSVLWHTHVLIRPCGSNAMMDVLFGNSLYIY